MSEFLIKSKHFTTKHIWFVDKIGGIKYLLGISLDHLMIDRYHNK